jgi:hypothetical protein
MIFCAEAKPICDSLNIAFNKLQVVDEDSAPREEGYKVAHAHSDYRLMVDTTAQKPLFAFILKLSGEG